MNQPCYLELLAPQPAIEGVVVRGPMHPDLFDGISPTSVVVPEAEAASAFDVTLRCHSTTTVRVIAASYEDACRIAVLNCDEDPEWEADMATASDRAATAEEIGRHLDWHGRVS